jgi:hypothetical protein
MMHDPEGGPVIQGTGGLRKMRFSPKKWSVGKSGAVRVCYVYFKVHWTIMLIMAYGKGRKDNLTATEKRDIARYIKSVEQWFQSRSK